MADTILLLWANPSCRREIIRCESGHRRRYCHDPACCRERAAARQAHHDREVATKPERKVEYQQMLTRKQAERHRRERCRQVVPPAKQKKGRRTASAGGGAGNGGAAALLMLLVCFVTIQAGALAIMLSIKSTAALLGQLENCFRVGRELLGPNLENLPLREIFLTGIFRSDSSQQPASPASAGILTATLPRPPLR
ncbi:MAG: hypothetical protein PHC30_10450 [Lentisphaeria bacterium]|nr:hypothetical protein [Lentisphaeria bacterium]